MFSIFMIKKLIYNKKSKDNGVLICNKSDQHRALIELLYESKKRTGGEDIKELHFDKSLNQYLCIYYRPETSRNVIRNGPVTFNQNVFVPMEIDRSKIILENVDETLELDVISLYAEYLFQDVSRGRACDQGGPRVERLRSGFVMVDLDHSYGIKLFTKISFFINSCYYD